jgi:signal peptidase I
MKWSIRYAYPLSITFVGILLIRTYVITPFIVPSSSMSPTITKGDFVLVDRQAYVRESPKTGDLVVYDDKEGNQFMLIKRIVGMPGDVIEYRDKKLSINGVTLDTSEHYTIEGEALNTLITRLPNGHEHAIQIDQNKKRFDDGKWVVPENEYFVLGDNRDFSVDSRYTGTVPLENVHGKLFRKVMSWTNFSGMPSFTWSGVK